MKRLIVDLDGTLTQGNASNYPNVLPRHEVIEELRAYRDRGFTITILTARNMRTYEGNVGKINIHTLPIITEWLDRHKVPYDEVLVGKPWCGYEGFYIDDRTVRPSEFVSLPLEQIHELFEKEGQLFLIMSGAYIDQEMQSEFGGIPPCMLPLGNRRLFQHQIASAPSEAAVYLVLPESFQLSEYDREHLAQDMVEVVRTPDGISLGAAVVSALNLVDSPPDDELEILLGDTLISPLPSGQDILVVAKVEHSYEWTIVTNDSASWLADKKNGLGLDEKLVVSGFFRLSQPKQLVRSVIQANWDFIEGLNRYHNEVGLNAVRVDHWLDFGHLNNFFRSKATFTTQRAFNDLKVTPEWVEKSSDETAKLRAEAHWFESLPADLRAYTPHYLGVADQGDKFAYRLEYLHLSALNELYVFSELPVLSWRIILSRCFDFLDRCRFHLDPNQSSGATFQALFVEKTHRRLNEYCKTYGLNHQQLWTFNGGVPVSLEHLLSATAAHLPAEEMPLSLIHGDFCFSNILYDFRADRIKALDPRGLDPSGRETIFGDPRYDVAKLGHSIVGMYDWIIAGNSTVSIEDGKISLELRGLERVADVQRYFVELAKESFGLSEKNLYAMQIELFLSMLPLHFDDVSRQKALFANAFRLFSAMMESEK